MERSVSAKDGTLGTVILFVFGIILLFLFLLFMREGELLRIMSASSSVSLSVYNQGFASYVAALFFWSVLIGIVGLVWSYVFDRSMRHGSRVLFALSFGAFVLPLSFTLPMVFAVLAGPDSVAYLFVENELIGMLADNTEQSYEAMTLLLVFVLGVMFLILKEILFQGKKIQPISKYNGTST